MIDGKHITITVLKDLRPLVKDFSFTISDGEKIGLIGEEGNGKSTLLKALYDPSLIEGYAQLDGSIVCSKGRKAYLSQFAFDEIIEGSVYSYLSANSDLNKMEWEEIDSWCRKLNLDSELLYSERNYSSLSGGERMKLKLFAILASKPTFLFLDEPTNDLDEESRRALASVISSYPYTVIFVTHDVELLRRCATGLIHLEIANKKTEPKAETIHDPYDVYLEKRQNSLEKQNELALNQRRQKEIRDRKYQRLYQNVRTQLENTNSRDPITGRLLKKKMKAVKAMGARFEKEDEKMVKIPHPEREMGLTLWKERPANEGNLLLELEIPEFKVGEKVLAHNLRFAIHYGERICIIGNNGVGKSTFLDLLWSKLKSHRDLKPLYMTQDYTRFFDSEESAVEFVSSHSSLKEDKEKARDYLGAAGLVYTEMERPSKELSGGEKAKAFFAKMAYEQNRLILMDEPNRNVSPLQLPFLVRMISEYEGTMIYVTHDKECMASADKVIKLAESVFIEVDEL